MHVIGTAGHVDHGKSTLIKALTDVHPDRLAEEREREMSIVLGFGSLTLPGGGEVSIVDVPGHRDFIENMLSGIGAIDAAILVVAADEGVMPQTEEHLAILDLLEVPAGIIALTKIDLVEDREWIDLVELDLRETLQGTVLAEAPIIRVSGKTGEGLEAFLEELSDLLSNRPPRPDLGRPRLSIDRAFTISGFGTVVTGTLLDGVFRVGDEIEILPGRMKGRIRGLQSHNRKEDTALPGTRTAVNISGVDTEHIQRGDVVSHPSQYQTTRRFDVRFRLLEDVIKPVTHNMKAKLFLGADEVMARIRLLGAKILQPGQEGWLQIEVEEPVVTLRGDHYILRRPSPSETIGGGIVLDPHPRYRHKRFDEDVLTRLEALAGGNPETILRQLIQSAGALPWQDLITEASLAGDQALEILDELVAAGSAVQIKGSKNSIYVADSAYWDEQKDLLRKMVKRYHQKYPLRTGISREELKSQYNGCEDVFEILVTALLDVGDLKQEGPIITQPGHTIQFSPDQERLIDGVLEKFRSAPYMPPTVKECRETLGDELYNALLTIGKLKQLNPEVVFLEETYREGLERVKQYLESHTGITVAEARDLFDSSRRYILALLEHMDGLGITVRVGDVRHLKRAA